MTAERYSVLMGGGKKNWFKQHLMIGAANDFTSGHQKNLLVKFSCGH